jgi:hypothetical protein
MWTSPDGKTHNHIDQILIDWGRHPSLLNVQSFRAPDCHNEHYLMFAKVWERLSVSKQAAQTSDTEKFNIRKINELEITKQDRIKISNGFAALENLKEIMRK